MAKIGNSKKKYSEAGKGAIPRRGISQDRWEERWEKIFRKKHKGVKKNDERLKDKN